MSSLPEALATVGSLLRDADHLVRATANGCRRGEEIPWRRAEIRYVDLKAGRHVQVTRYDTTQAHTHNTPLAELDDVIEELVSLPWTSWHVETARPDDGLITSLRVTKKGDALLSEHRQDRAVEVQHAHDRAKIRIIEAGDPLLSALGIADSEGRIKPSRQAKLRQIEEFCRLLAPSVDDLMDRLEVSAQRPLRVVDLGCGNAYLTFAAWRYLTGVRGLPVSMVGVDVKQQAFERNSGLGDQLGAGDSLRFAVGGIAEAELSERPDVVLALHACDTATDDALARAIGWKSELILAAPCCHHYLQQQLKQVEIPVPYALITRHGILRERLADTLTDAMRAALLRLHGYRVEAVEFVDSRHTPRNTLLRAVRTGVTASQEAHEEYARFVAEWGVQPRLAELVGGGG